MPEPVVGSGRFAFTLRWFGPEDPVSLERIRQVPGLDGVVTALHEAPSDHPWSIEAIRERKEILARHGLSWLVAESVPVHEDVKSGGPARDVHVERFVASIRNLASEGVRTVCYNFMPVFDWFRTEFHADVGDGSTAMRFVQADFDAYDPSAGMERLAAWARGYSGEELVAQITAYAEMGADGLRENLATFLRDVVPSAEECGVTLAIHPDDPPWPVLGLPRIVSTRDDLAWILAAVDRPANGLTFCTGALGAREENDLPAMAAEFADRIHFVHARNLRRTGPRDFIESAHLRGEGNVDLYPVLETLLDHGFRGPLRPDHGRTLWGEEAIPGYGLYDRALGLSYMQGIAEAIDRRGHGVRDARPLHAPDDSVHWPKP